MSLRILVLGRVSPATLDALRALEDGCEVLDSARAQEAWRHMAAAGPDVVVLGPSRVGEPPVPEAFARLLENEFSRALRYRHPIAVVFVTIDGLPDLRTTHGDAGAAAYVETLEIALRRSLRAIDVLAPTGEGEMAAILPETAIAGAATVAERLRTVAAGLIVKPSGAGDRRGLPVKATCSVGVADAPSEGIVTSRDLLSRAREGALRARDAGGDRVGP